jgi:hypothetical protein
MSPIYTDADVELIIAEKMQLVFGDVPREEPLNGLRPIYEARAMGACAALPSTITDRVYEALMIEFMWRVD